MATPNDPTTSHGPLDAVIASSILAPWTGLEPATSTLEESCSLRLSYQGDHARVIGGECPRQELNLVLDLRKVVCESVTLRGRIKALSPARKSNPALRLRRPRCDRHTRGERFVQFDSPHERALAQAMASAGSCFRNLAQLSMRAPCAA